MIFYEGIYEKNKQLDRRQIGKRMVVKTELKLIRKMPKTRVNMWTGPTAYHQVKKRGCGEGQVNRINGASFN